MGIKGNFYKFLSANAGGGISRVAITQERFPSIAVDLPIYLNKYKAIYGSAWRENFGRFLDFFVNREIALWCVFDGKSPIEKRSECERRQKNRARNYETVQRTEAALKEYTQSGVANPHLIELNKRFIPSFLTHEEICVSQITRYIDKMKSHMYKLEPDDYEWAANAIAIRGLTSLTALEEAEKMCARLCKNGTCIAAMSDDSDLFAYMCPTIITKIDVSSATCQVIDMTRVLNDLCLSREQFLDLCIMCGTDYNNNCPGIATIRAYQYITKYTSIEDFARETNTDVTVLNYSRVRQLFTL